MVPDAAQASSMARRAVPPAKRTQVFDKPRAAKPFGVRLKEIWRKHTAGVIILAFLVLSVLVIVLFGRNRYIAGWASSKVRLPTVYCVNEVLCDFIHTC